MQKGPYERHLTLAIFNIAHTNMEKTKFLNLSKVDFSLAHKIYLVSQM